MNATLPEFLSKIVDLLLDAICVVDVDHRFVYVSAAFERIFGYAPEEVCGRDLFALVHPNDRARTLHAATDVMGGLEHLEFENRYLHKDGRVVHVMWSARWLEPERLRVAVARDVSARRHAEMRQRAVYAVAEAANEAENLDALLTRVHHIVGALLPMDGLEIRIDGLTGAASSTAVAQLDAEIHRTGLPHLLTATGGVEPFEDSRQRPAAASPDWVGVPLKHRDGVAGTLIVRREPRIGQPCYAQTDLDLLQFIAAQVALAVERRRLAIQLEHAAGHDPLTDLSNRALFQIRLQAALARADGAHAHQNSALLYLDLDDFKQINDRCGHACGDRMLQIVAARLRRCTRTSDTVARFGGDEFVVLLENVATIEQARLLAEKIRRAVARPFNVDGRSLRTTTSIGLVHDVEHGRDGARLIRQADAAMYAAKADGGNRVQVAPHLQRSTEPKGRADKIPSR